MSTTTKSNKRTMVGLVVSDSSDKTVVVRVESLIKHPLLAKYIRRRNKLMAHDPQNECKVGDKVEVIEHRPLSKRKRWHLLRIIDKAV